MGRKNRNARGRVQQTYPNFQALKEPTVQFDLTKGTFFKKKTDRGSNTKAKSDIYVSIVRNSEAHRITKSLCFSIGTEIAESIGSYITVGIVKNNEYERLYLIGTDPHSGYKFTAGSSAKRRYIRISIEEDQAKPYERYTGDHEAQYDPVNKAYYVIPEC